MEREVEDRVVAMEAVVASSKDGGVQGRRSGRPVGSSGKPKQSGVPSPTCLTSGAGSSRFSHQPPCPPAPQLSKSETTQCPQESTHLLLFLYTSYDLMPPQGLCTNYFLPSPCVQVPSRSGFLGAQNPGGQVTFIFQRGVAAGPAKVILRIFSLTGDLAGRESSCGPQGFDSQQGTTPFLGWRGLQGCRGKRAGVRCCGSLRFFFLSLFFSFLLFFLFVF